MGKRKRPDCGVIEVFMLQEQHRFLVVLECFDWDFTLGLMVELRGRGGALTARQTGTADHEGHAVVQLEPLTTWDDALAAVERFQGEPVVIGYPAPPPLTQGD
jgi:hypothetical protein